VGPRQFYFSNDSGATDRIGKRLELYFQLPLSNIVYYDGEDLKKVAENIACANGLALGNDGKRLYATSTVGRLMRVYDRDTASGALTMIKDINLGTGIDNINTDSEGNIWAGCIPKLVTYDISSKYPSKLKLAPSQVLMIKPLKNDMFEIKEIYLNAGEEISWSTCAAHFKNRLFIGTAWDDHFLDCRQK